MDGPRGLMGDIPFFFFFFLFLFKTGSHSVAQVGLEFAFFFCLSLPSAGVTGFSTVLREMQKYHTCVLLPLVMEG
jgi:hypothetical protein